MFRSQEADASYHTHETQDCNMRRRVCIHDGGNECQDSACCHLRRGRQTGQDFRGKCLATGGARLVDALARSGRLLDAPAEQAASASFAIRRGAPAFLWTFAEEADIVGPMALRIGTSMSTCLPLGSRCIRICTPTSPPWRDPSGRPCAEFPCDTIPERRRSASRDARAVALSQEPLLGNFPIRLQAEPERNMRRPHGRFL